MCGISGAYSADLSKEINRHMFERSIQSLQHRGPDHCGTWSHPGITLGHTRLSIIDVSAAANQPFLSPDGRFAIVFNGEIFNYQALANELKQLGIPLRTQSDTEVLLYLLIQQGIKALDKVVGFFAFAFYAKDNHELLVARDRFGEKPLFYSHDLVNGRFFFASELKAVLPFIDQPRVNFDALQLLLQLTYIPAPLTIVEQVHKLEPGTYLQVNSTGCQKKKYYTLPHLPQPVHDERHGIEGVRAQVQRAVQSRMVADVPVAGFLSGGIDSSIVSALAHQINPAYETFSLGFSGTKVFDESADAERAAKHYGIHHHTIRLTENELLENVERLLAQNDEPFGDSSAIALYSLCRTIKGKYKVVLSGDGADEIFGGYNKHYALYLAQQKTFSSRLVKHGGMVHRLLPKSRKTIIGNKARQLEKMHRLFRKKEFDRYWYLATFDHGWARHLLKKGSEKYFVDQLRENFPGNDFNDYLRLDLQLVLPGDMLYKVDMSSMLNAVEIRSPFLDHQLIEYVFSLPGSWKLRNGDKKHLLKKAFHDLLPHELLHKPKHGFEVPLQDWLNGPLKHRVQKYLSPAFIQEQNIFDPVAVSKLLRKLNSSNPGDSAALVWTLLSFQQTWSTCFNA